MQWKNSSTRYGWVSILLHWLMALAIISMFVLGKFIVDLDYYSSWYHIAPDAHRSVGVVLGTLLVFRFIWRLRNIEPSLEGKSWEKGGAHIVHLSFYLLLLLIVISGYLITTADGQGILVFGWFEIPATLSNIEHQEDIAGVVHNGLATFTIALAGLHGAAALKHHFIEKDGTLMKMLGCSSQSTSEDKIHPEEGIHES